MLIFYFPQSIHPSTVINWNSTISENCSFPHFISIQYGLMDIYLLFYGLYSSDFIISFAQIAPALPLELFQYGSHVLSNTIPFFSLSILLLGIHQGVPDTFINHFSKNWRIRNKKLDPWFVH